LLDSQDSSIKIAAASALAKLAGYNEPEQRNIGDSWVALIKAQAQLRSTIKARFCDSICGSISSIINLLNSSDPDARSSVLSMFVTLAQYCKPQP
jgi:hypothetical protein